MRWLLPAAITLSACETNWVEEEVEGLRVLTTTVDTRARRKIPVNFRVEEGEDAFLLTLNPAIDTLGYIYEMRAPGVGLAFEAEPLWESNRTKTNAAFAASVTSLNWPINEDDAALSPGMWKVDARVEDDAQVDITLALRKTDTDPVDRLAVKILLLGNLSENTDIVQATTAAVRHWTDNIYGPAGIDLDSEILAYDGPEDLASANRGDPLYAEVSADFPLRTVTVVVVDRVIDGPGILGVSGGIPGALAVTERSSVTISALEARGGDDAFSLVEQRLLGETMAHEVSHYLGLFHPVELPDDRGNLHTWDSIDDTEECQTLQACDRQLSSNLMYPTPVCEPDAISGLGSCSAFVSQVEISEQQRGVLDHYVAID